MIKDNYILGEALNSLYNFTNIQAILSDTRDRRKALLSIAGEEFALKVKPEITKGNKGLVLAELKESSFENNLPPLLLTQYIPSDIAKEYVEERVNYLDVAGNCNIRSGRLFILIEGKKSEHAAKTNKPRAFQEAGIKLIFIFLVKPESVKLPYRELADLAGISLGSVAAIMQELCDQNFLLRTKQTKKLKNSNRLLERWIIAYHDVLRPRLILRQMRFAKSENLTAWKSVNLASQPGLAYWGGEAAANLITGYLHPGSLTIYTNRSWQSFKDIGLLPDESGNVQILELFWKPDFHTGIPPVLIYADLMSSGSNRNLETAKMIYDRELQYLK